MTEHPVDTRPLRGTPVFTGLDTMRAGGVYRRPQGLGSHLLVYTTAGEGHIGPAGAKLLQKTGRLLVIDPHRGVDQDVACDQSWGRIWVIFEPRDHWYAWMDWPQPIPGYRWLDLHASPVQDAVAGHLTRMHQLSVARVRTSHPLAMNALEAALILAHETTAAAGNPQYDPRLEAALAYIGNHIRQRLSLKSIAQAGHVSAPHLSRLFRAKLGRSVMSYVENERMTRACQLLEMTSQPIALIAREVGYDDPFYFSTRFKRMLKTSPGAYRAARNGRP